MAHAWTGVDGDNRQELSGKLIVPARDSENHGVIYAEIFSYGKGQHYDPAFAQTIKPGRMRMGHSRIDEDGITGNRIDISSISVHHFHVVVLCQICGGNFGESGID